MQRGVEQHPRLVDRLAKPAIAILEFGIMARRFAQKRDPAAPLRDQMASGVAPAADIVAPDRRIGGLVRPHRSPTYEMRVLRREQIEPRAILLIIAIAEQDDAVGLAAILIIDVPVVRQLLKRNQQIIAAQSARPCDRPEHRQEERVDQRIVGCGIFEKQQGERVRTAAPQVRRILVDLIVELLRDRFDPQPRGCAHRPVSAQRARHGRLRHAGERRNIERCRFVVQRHLRKRFLSLIGAGLPVAAPGVRLA